MVLTPEQQSKIAAVYEKAAADKIGVPRQQRAAFARKAQWFRMLARIGAKKVAASAVSNQVAPPGFDTERACQRGGGWSVPTARRETIPSDWGRRGRGANLACAEAIYEAIYIVSERSPVRELA
jgi:hypothetical protein